MTISPPSTAFPGVVGSTSDPVTFVVRNNGTASSGAVTAALGGIGAAQFSITTNTCSGVLAGLATCTVAVVYKPTAAGAVTATLTATDATVGSTPAAATLTGTAVTEGFLAITGPRDLGSVTVGATPASAIFTVTNGGGSAAPSVVLGPANDPQFAIGNNMCTDLAAAATCTFTVTFAPTSPGLKSTVLTAKSGDISGQRPIQGTGVAAPTPAALSMSPATLDFGTMGVGTTSTPQTFTVTNTGGTASGPLTVTKLDSPSSVGGASQFTYTSTCASSLASGASCFGTVTFKPTIPGSASANFTVGDGTVSSPARTATGIALSPP